MRWIAVWRRNFLVWRKLVIASVLTNLADPLILLFGLGYGLGAPQLNVDDAAFEIARIAGRIGPIAGHFEQSRAVRQIPGFDLVLAGSDAAHPARV